MMRALRHECVTFLWRDPRNLRQLLIEISSVRIAKIRLLAQSIELAIQDRTGEFVEPMIAADDVMFVPFPARHSATVVDGATPRGKLVVVADENSALAGGHVLARLKRERPDVPDRADLASLIF